MQSTNFFSDKESQQSLLQKVPKTQARVLLNGQILDKGFKTKIVYSPCAYALPDGTLQYPQLGETAQVDTEILMQAVDAASKAWNKGQGEWPTARTEERLNAVVNFRNQLKSKREEISTLLMWEIAKTKTDSLAEFDRTVQYIDDTIEEFKKLDRDCSRFQFAGGLMAQIRRAPLGVNLCMGPFNYPLNETFTTLIPALIMGNVVVVKAPRFGQLLWDVLLEPFRDCFPAGVVNIVNGLGRQIVSTAIQSGKVDVLAFIGSSTVANKIKLAHPQPNRLRSILGLDAKNPGIVFPDADLDTAVSECVKGSLSFNGQRCTALKMLFIHKSIEKEFTARFTAAVESLRCGMPWEDGVSITPLADVNKPAHLKTLIADAVQHGAEICNPQTGGIDFGSLLLPAVLRNVSLECLLAKEEQFGPVVPISTFENIEEVENYIVHSPYGAQVSLFGRSPDVIGSAIDRLRNQVCRINLNSQCQRGPDVFPFTGRKDSAEGTLSVFDALRAFSIRTMVAAKQDPAGRELIRGMLDHDSSHFLTTNIVL
ncbi:MAG: aldehyde dehydrogenase family protein [Pseudobdellovibrionaceae bacterium]